MQPKVFGAVVLSSYDLAAKLVWWTGFNPRYSLPLEETHKRDQEFN